MGIPDWLSRYFQQPTIRDQNGNDMPSRSNIKFVNATVTDDKANDQTVVNLSSSSINAIVHALTSAHDGPTYTVAETSGEVSLIVRTITAAFTVKFPSAPTVGMKIKVKAADTSFSNVNTITADGNGQLVEREGVTAATFIMKPDNVGPGGSLEWEWDGIDWVNQ